MMKVVVHLIVGATCLGDGVLDLLPDRRRHRSANTGGRDPPRLDLRGAARRVPAHRAARGPLDRRGRHPSDPRARRGAAA